MVARSSSGSVKFGKPGYSDAIPGGKFCRDIGVAERPCGAARPPSGPPCCHPSRLAIEIAKASRRIGRPFRDKKNTRTSKRTGIAPMEAQVNAGVKPTAEHQKWSPAPDAG